jgi:Rad3-related DNA helicase
MDVLPDLCGAHFLKIITQKVKNIFKYKDSNKSRNLEESNNSQNTKESLIILTKNKTLQKSFIFAFTPLQAATKIEEFIEVFIHIHNVYNKRKILKEVENSCCIIKNKLKSSEVETTSLKKDTINPFEPDLQFQNVEDQYHKCAKFNNSDEESLQEKSKFTKYFNLLES